MRVAVIGAGISGLTAAWRLQQGGAEVVVYEREQRVGGRMSTVRADGFQVDIGAHLLLDNNLRVRALAAEVGLEGQWFALEAGSQGGILKDDRLTSFAPENLPDLLGYGGLSLWSRIRLLGFMLRARRWRKDLDFYDLSVDGDELDTVDVYSWSVDHLGQQVADWLVDPFVRTFHFHTSRRMSMKYFDAIAALFSQGGFSPHAFRGYMIALPQALADRLDVRLGSAVTRVRPVGEAVELEVDGSTERFDAVIVATTASVARELLVDPGPEQRRLLDAVRYATSAICAYKVPLSVAEDFEGIWVPFAESALISGCANESCKGSVDERHCVYSIALDQEMARPLIALEDGPLLEAVAVEFERLFPKYRGALEPLYVQRWPEAMPVYDVGYVTEVKRFWSAGQGDGSVFLCGDYLNHPWVEGSVRCGEKVARAVLQR